jgi:diketogulonate reductase-like aldo/keto reductase
MYADAEQVVGRVLPGRRESVFVVSKVLPTNASRQGTLEAAERSLRALQTEVIDLYLLHWEGSFPLEDTFEAFGELRDAGKIRYFGVSNFEPADLRRALLVERGADVASNQVLYNLARRQAENDLLQTCQQLDVNLMAYSPLERNRMLDHPTLTKLATQHQSTPAAIALAWLLRHEEVIAIPKAVRLEHVRDNARALELELDSANLRILDEAFPPPRGPQPLDWH